MRCRIILTMKNILYVEHYIVNGTFTQIGETDANTTSYTAQLDNSVTNYYRVYAKNS